MRLAGGNMSENEQVAPRRDAVLADEDLSNLGARLVRQVLYPFAIFAAPAFLLSLICYLTIGAFFDGLGVGVRSFAAVLLPLMALTLLVSYRQDVVRTTAEKAPNLAAFVASLAVGARAVWMLQFSSTIPLTEMILSGAFSVLVGTFVVLERERYIAYYFGLILGVLGYVVAFGFHV
jgi:hypothetical protein